MIAPAIKAALPYVPYPARIIQPLEHFIGQNLHLVAALLKADCSTTSALPILLRDHPSGKKSEHFLSEQDRK